MSYIFLIFFLEPFSREVDWRVKSLFFCEFIAICALFEKDLLTYYLRSANTG